MGWELAGLQLDTGASQLAPAPRRRSYAVAEAARRLADRAGVLRTTFGRFEADAVADNARESPRTQYRFDVRDLDEYVAGHPSGFRRAPGGQLVQETDYYAPVRGATIALADDHGGRANVTGSWLAQMGWRVKVIEDALEEAPVEKGPWQPRSAILPGARTVTTPECSALSGRRVGTVH